MPFPNGQNIFYFHTVRIDRPVVKLVLTLSVNRKPGIRFVRWKLNSNKMFWSSKMQKGSATLGNSNLNRNQEKKEEYGPTDGWKDVDKKVCFAGSSVLYQSTVLATMCKIQLQEYSNKLTTVYNGQQPCGRSRNCRLPTRISDVPEIQPTVLPDF